MDAFQECARIGPGTLLCFLNGVPNFSVLDGWWIEGHIEDVTGWSIGIDHRTLVAPIALTTRSMLLGASTFVIPVIFAGRTSRQP